MNVLKRLTAITAAFLLVVSCLSPLNVSASETPQETAMEVDSSFASYGGSIARVGEYTYFKQAAFDNDFSVSGTMHSENIYRISDAPDAVPELIYIQPCMVAAGVEQNTLSHLKGYDQKLYFLTRNWNVNDLAESSEMKEQLTLHCVDIAHWKEEMVDIELPEKVPCFDQVLADGHMYYFLASGPVEMHPAYPEDPDYARSGSMMIAYDLDTQEFCNIDLQPENLPEKSYIHVLTISHDEVYFVYALWDAENWYYTEGERALYRMKLGSNQAEKVADVNVDELVDSNFIYANEQWLYYTTEESDFAGIDLAKGEAVSIFTQDQGFMDYVNTPVFVTDEALYLITPFETYKTDPDGTHAVEGPQSEMWEMKVAPYVSGDWLYYCPQDDGVIQYQRVLMSEKVDASQSMIPEAEASAYPEKENENWFFYEYPNAVLLSGCKNPTAELTLPTEINGKPVCAVSAWSSDGHDFAGVKTLIIPEGCFAIEYLYIPGCETIYLPQSLQRCCNGSFLKSFRTDTLTEIIYPGDFETEFLPMVRYSGLLGDGMGTDSGSGETTFKITCQDGSYQLTDESEPYAPVFEPWVENSFTISEEELLARIDQIRAWFYNPTDEIEVIIVPMGTNDWWYERNYYLIHGELFFAYIFNGEDQHRLYFQDENLIRYIDENHYTYDFPFDYDFSSWSDYALWEAHNPPVKEVKDPASWIGTWVADNGEKWEVVAANDQGITVIHHFMYEIGDGSMGTFTYWLEFRDSEKTLCSESDSVLSTSGWVYRLENKGDYLIQYSRYPDRYFYRQ